ncbi:hypothetical protein E2C01_099773 [Portunus trituberculatus]|uniref:Uncharacterized protein n=1 Tax=Portunus trituberculatus TaxID=210409 RepID=A0A5B7K6D6_PORTR|nr:hypothetical protein [Portunus trituberculatus]
MTSFRLSKEDATGTYSYDFNN